MSFGENLCKARKLKGLSQEELAFQLNVSRQSVSFWENNQTVPSFENLLAICNILEVNSSILLGQEEFPDEKKERERLLRIEENKRKEEERKKEYEIKRNNEKEKEFKKNNLIALILSVASIFLAFIPGFGIVFSISAIIVSIIARKYRHNTMNLISFVLGITYLLAAICFLVYVVEGGLLWKRNF